MTATGSSVFARLDPALAATRTALDQPAIPWLLGLLAIAITTITWGGISPGGVYHDEAAYLLQAALFARGRVVGPVPPIPEFFVQFHVLMVPGIVPKYPPGFALSLTPGIWLGIPALMPLLLTGLTVGLGFALARRLVSGPTALLAAIIWMGAPGNLRFRSGYFSETLTSLLWILGWWALVRWRAEHRTGWLIALAAVTGFAAVTRPLTALVFAVPIGIVVLRDVARRRAWPALAVALVTGASIVSFLPIQNRLVTGDWRATPYAAYTAAYLPFDRMGFGLDSTPATSALPPDMRALTAFFTPVHVEHTAARLPATVLKRTVAVLRDMGGPTTVVTALLVLAGTVAAPAAVQVAVATAALLLLAHLPYAHFAVWTLYYLEAFPVLALLMAIGIARLGRLRLREGSRSAAPQGSDLLVVAAAVVLAIGIPARVLTAREAYRRVSAGQSYFRALVRALPGPAVVFVRYGPRHVMHYSLIENPPDYDSAHAWVVHDRGVDNARLLSLAGGRSAWLYDEESLELTPLVVARRQSP